MNRILLINILKAKFDLTQAMIKYLPENLQSPVKQVQQEILQSTQEAIKAFLENSNEQANKSASAVNAKGLKTIDID